MSKKHSINTLGVKFIGHDSGVALIYGKEVVAISEERLTRVKYAPNTFPDKSLQYCLAVADLEPADITLVVTDAVKYAPTLADFHKQSIEKLKTLFPNAEVRMVNHHDLHAASAFFASPFDESAVLVYDGFGEEFASHLGITVVECNTTYFGKGNTLTQINKTVHHTGGTWPPKHSSGIGVLYTFLSHRYLGFGKYNEGKMMGLASYGDDSVLDAIPLSRWFKEDHGKIACNPRITYPLDPFWESFKTIPPKSIPHFLIYRLKYFLVSHLPALLLKVVKTNSDKYFFEKIYLSKPPRKPNTPLPEPYYASVARAGQKVLEAVALNITRRLFAITRSKNIAIAGGVGLNIDANRRILDESGFKNIFIQPAASDAGIPLGAALYGYHVILGQQRFFTMRNAYLGREYSRQDILKALSKYSHKVMYQSSQNIAVETASLIAQGNIIGWFQGATEYGPRALGHRSIVCDARQADMKDTVNLRIKHREPWRPFAASVLRESMTEFFDLDQDSPFMILLGNVHEEKRNLIPSVVHVDGTCRLQTVTKEDNDRYYDLIKEFQALTGVGLVLNTSFNLAGEPIVETPDDALDSFLRTDMDYIVLGTFLVKKKEI